MKLTYRGTSYDYSPPAVEGNVSDSDGKYRGLDIRFRNVKKSPVQQPTLDLLYRGVAHSANQVAPVVEVAATSEPVSVPAVLVQAAASMQDQARSRMMNQHRVIKRRQQAMLSRLDVEVGLTAGDAARYWNHIQGKVHPTFRLSYDRSRAALS